MPFMPLDLKHLKLTVECGVKVAPFGPLNTIQWSNANSHFNYCLE